MATKMHFGEFNPLDVLAAAATLQQSVQVEADCEEDQGTGEEGSAEGEDGSAEGDDKDGTLNAPTESTTCNMPPRNTSAVIQNATKTPSEVSPSTTGSSSTCIVKVVTKPSVRMVNGNHSHPLVTLRDTSKVTVPTKEAPRMLTVLKIPKGQSADHSYAFMQVCGNAQDSSHNRLHKTESTEDDGYCSRSSLDSPGQSSRSDGDTNDQDVFSDTDLRSPTGTPSTVTLSVAPSAFKSPAGIVTSPSLKVTGALSPPTSQVVTPLSRQSLLTSGQQLQAKKKPTKIVIVSRDANLKKLLTCPESNFMVSTTPTASGSQQAVEEVGREGVEHSLSNGDIQDEEEMEHSLEPVRVNGFATKLANVHTVMEDVQSWAGCGSQEDSSDSQTNPPAQSPTPALDNTCDALSQAGNVTGNANNELQKEGAECRLVLSHPSPVSATQIEPIQNSQTDTDALDGGQIDCFSNTSQPQDSKCHTYISPASKDSTEDSGAQSQQDVTAAAQGSSAASGSDSSAEHHLGESGKSIAGSSECIADNNNSSSLTVLDSGVDHYDSEPQPQQQEKQEQPADEAGSESTIHCHSECATSAATVVTTASDLGLPSPGAKSLLSAVHHHNVSLPTSGSTSQLAKCSTSQGVRLVTSKPALTKTAVTASGTNFVSGAPGTVFIVRPVTSTAQGGTTAKDAPNRYIIQDDLPPVTKSTAPMHKEVLKVKSPHTDSADTSATTTTTTMGTLIAPKLQGTSTTLFTKGSANSWQVLGTLDPKGTLVTTYPQSTPSKTKPTTSFTATSLADVKTSPAAKTSPRLSLLDTKQQSLLIDNVTEKDKTGDPESKEVSLTPVSSPLPSPGPGSTQLMSPPGTCQLLLVKQDNLYRPKGPASMALSCRTPSPMLSASPILPSISTSSPSSVLSSPSDPPPSSSSSLLSSANNKINIKISGSKVIDVTCTDEQGISVKKAATSIGHVGSLSWQNLPSEAGASKEASSPYLRILSSSPVPGHHINLTPSACSSPGPSTPRCGTPVQPFGSQPPKRTYTRRNKTQTHKKSMPSLLTEPGLDLHSHLDNDLGEEDTEKSARTCHTYVKRRRVRSGSGSSSHSAAGISPTQRELCRMKQSAQLMSRLHPLIDHDYCQFSEFSAEIQSSIIATTETKLRTEKKYGKKTKAARTKAVRVLSSPEKPGGIVEKPKKRKYTKRKLAAKLQMLADLEEPDIVVSKADNIVDVPASIKEEKPGKGTSETGLKLRKKHLSLEKKLSKYSPYKERPDKNYVKIPGSYQDDFVYYATRKTSKRVRKPAEILPDLHKPPPPKPLQVGGINVFDWYQEMSKVDKTKFGVGASVADYSTVEDKALMSADKGNMMLSPPPPPRFSGGITPTHESEVLDLVMDMQSNLMDGVPSSQASMMPGMADTNVEKVETVETTEDIDLMAEEVRNMLNSMNESELRLLSENLGDKDISSTAAAFPEVSNSDTKDLPPSTSAVPPVPLERGDSGNFSSILDTAPSLSQTSTGSNLLGDLDDINDSDLLPSDISHDINNIMLGDLAVTSSAANMPIVPTSTSTSVSLDTLKQPILTSSPSRSYSQPLSSHSQQSSELFPDISRPAVPPSAPTTNGIATVAASHSVPELTTVTMYWNDLPGLIINGQEHVRLVDIHKQVLPAKDTGILKKRCQMMGLEIINCSELQRDFLIRYMNAAKSKSCVITSKESAKTLIGFYVDPRPRVPRHAAESETETEAEEDEDRKKATQKMEESTDFRKKPLPGDGTSVLPQQPGVQPLGTKESVVVEIMDVQTATIDVAPATAKTTAGKNKPNAGLPITPDSMSVKTKPRPRKENGPSNLPTGVDVKRSARLRHTRKVSYAAMHNGVAEADEESNSLQGDNSLNAEDAPVPTQPAATAKEPAVSPSKKTQQESVKVLDDNSELQNHILTEETEIRRLVNKKKRKGLNKRELRRLQRLRDKAKQRRLKAKYKDSKKHKENREKWLKNLVKAKEKLRQKKLEQKEAATGVEKKTPSTGTENKFDQEHCYASWHAKLGANKQKIVTKDDENNVTEPLCNDGISSVDVQPEVENAKASVKIDDDNTPTDKPEVKTADQPGEGNAPTKEGERPPLQVTHRDQRNNHGRGKSQEGELYLHLFKSRDASCVLCTACREMMSVRKFMKHLHRLNNPDEIVAVTLPQKLELTSCSPADEENTMWEEYCHKCKEFEDLHQGRPKGERGRPKQSPRACNGNTKSPGSKNTSPRGVRLSSPETPSPRGHNHMKQGVSPKEEAGQMNSVTRHSTRIRKRKQFHPMESYVFADGETPSKRDRADI